jgi:hypothetical protein
MSALDDPRVSADVYVVRPTCYDEMINTDRDYWCLSVVNGHAWGWSVRRGVGMSGGPAMNRKDEWVYESRGSGRNKPRRWPLEEALTIALQHVDTHKLNGCTAAEASEWVRARRAAAEAAS